MSVIVSLDPSVEELRDTVEQASNTVLGRVLDDVLGRVVPEPAERVRLKSHLEPAVRGVFNDMLDAAFEALLDPDRIRMGAARIWNAMTRILDNDPAELRAKADRAQSRGNGARAQLLRERASKLEAERRGNG